MISTYVVDPKALIFTFVIAVAARVYIWRLAGGVNPRAAGKGEYGTKHWRAASDLGEH